MRAGLALGLLLAVWPCLASADEWPAPVPLHALSDNGQYLVRVVPGESLGDTFGFAESKKGAYARGEFYQKQPDRSYQLIADVPLQNPVAPAHILVSNLGYMGTFDNWHNAGYGKVVAIYRANGQLVRAYELEGLYSSEQIESIPRSVSSRGWLSPNYGFLNPGDQGEIYAYDFSGGLPMFDLTTGNHEYCERSKVMSCLFQHTK
ncbi:MAG: hypothetical protein Q8N04_04595 [Nitrospira sp.]|nr:hypothetical protein [Nitrospira sp.]